MKFVVITPSAPGHFNPTIPISKQLMEQGHEVIYVSNRRIKAMVNFLGFRFRLIDGNKRSASSHWEFLRRFIKQHWVGELAVDLYNNILNSLSEDIQQIVKIVESIQPDAILVDALAFAGAVAAEKLQIPWASSSMFPAQHFPHCEYPPYGFGMEYSQSWSDQFKWRLIELFSRGFYRHFDKRFNRIRKEWGLPSKEECFRTVTISPWLYLSYTIEELEYGRSEWPLQVHLVGPSLWDGEEFFNIPMWLDDLIKQGQPLIYITMGTAQSQIRRKTSLCEDIVAALKDTSYHIVMTTGWRSSPYVKINDISSNIHCEKYIPQSVLLPHIKLMIHHAGFSTNIGALVHGVPSIMLPTIGDQFENAQRTVSVGAGIRLHNQVEPKELNQIVQKALNDEEMRQNARRIQKRLSLCNGPSQAATLLLRLAKTCAPVLRNY